MDNASDDMTITCITTVYKDPLFLFICITKYSTININSTHDILFQLEHINFNVALEHDQIL
jgi:hypothetical protein